MSYADLSLLMTKVMAGLVLLFPIVIVSILSNNYQEIRKGKNFFGEKVYQLQILEIRPVTQGDHIQGLEGGRG